MMSELSEYDVALSFAGEDRAYVDEVANLLRQRGVRVFYDLFEEAELWGKDLYVHLAEIYTKRARFTVIFISAAYASKLWTNHERKAAQARAFQESQEYILPARFDATEVPGVTPTTGYVSLAGKSPADFASLVIKKLVSAGGSVPTELVRRDFSVISQTVTYENEFTVTVFDDDGNPVGGCQITLQAENGTYHTRKTSNEGDASFSLKTRRPVTLLVSNPVFPAAVFDRIDATGGFVVRLQRTENVGSKTIFGAGHLPDLSGRLNPIHDSISRTYLYAENISVNNGSGQPFHFRVNEPMELEDADGVVMFATIRHIHAEVCLIQFLRKPSV